MHRHPEKHWTLAMLAKESGLSRSLFCAEFAKTIGETPTRYLARVRLEQASELLRHSNLAIATIASHVGYSDPVTLGRAFKRHFGLSLGAFRAAANREAG
jgi:AraC-like DNA-binding protein